jgi:uncharacterized protein (DUF2132 family)
MNGEPNFNQYDNAQFIEVYANNMIVTTNCFINTAATPNLVSDLKPVDETSWAGPRTDSYVLYNGQQIRSYTVQDSHDETRMG